VTAPRQQPELTRDLLPETGLGDLMRVAMTLRPDAAALAAAAEFLGLAQKAQAPRAVNVEPMAEDGAVLQRSVPAPPATSSAPVKTASTGQPAFPVTAMYVPPRLPSSPRTTKSLDELLPKGPAPPPLQGLFPRQRARALLALVGARSRPDGDVDAARAVEVLARGEPLMDIPRLWVETTRGGLQLALDIGPGMEAYRRDVERLPEQLRSVLGPDGLELRWFQDCPMGGAGVLVPEALYPTPYCLPPPGTLIVAVTTFGARGGLPPPPSVLIRWHEFFAAAARGGILVVGLTPLPEHRLPAGLPRQLAVVTWDRAARVQHTTNTLRFAAHNKPRAVGGAR
jgi:hypothetical protein